MRLFHYSLLLAALCLVAIPVDALEMAPFRVRNLAPTALIHGTGVAEPARLLAPGAASGNISLGLASNARTSSTAGEHVTVDGETLLVTLGLRYGMSERLQIGFDLPWIRHDEGALDSFIAHWHDFFSLPDGDRDQLPQDQLNYVYRRNGDAKLQLDRSANGIGDLRLLCAWQLARNDHLAAALHAQLKAPTGSVDKLTGSDGWDASLVLAIDRRIPVERGRVAFWGGVGGSWLGRNQALGDRTEDWAANAWLGAGWSPRQWIAFKLQLDAQTALYDSTLVELGDPAVILTMGGDLALGPHTSLEIGVGEDLAVGASPDVTFHLGVTHRF